MKKKNRWIKIALLGFCMLGLAGCEYNNKYTGQNYHLGSDNEMIAVFQYLPAQKIAVAVKNKGAAEEFIEDILRVSNTKSAKMVRKDGRIIVIVETYGERAINLDEFE